MSACPGCGLDLNDPAPEPVSVCGICERSLDVPIPIFSLPDLVHLAELVEYVETVTGLNSRSDPQDHAGASIKPAAWVALLRRLMAGADPSLVAEARTRVKADFEARKGGGR